MSLMKTRLVGCMWRVHEKEGHVDKVINLVLYYSTEEGMHDL